MKTLHTFDEVLDTQKVFRLLLEAMANPGRRCSIKEQSQKLYGKQPALLAVAMTLLDNGISFSAPNNPELTEQIVLLTHARETSPGRADYIFLSSEEVLFECMVAAKDGTLENPHESATIILAKPTGEAEHTLTIRGPGVDGQQRVYMPAVVSRALTCRTQQGYEYPRGIDLIFLFPGDEVCCVPRLVRMEAE